VGVILIAVRTRASAGEPAGGNPPAGVWTDAPRILLDDEVFAAAASPRRVTVKSVIVAANPHVVLLTGGAPASE
jgi:hypothetical protein